MSLTKGKINTSRFFSMMHHEESPWKPQYNMATPISGPQRKRMKKSTPPPLGRVGGSSNYSYWAIIVLHSKNNSFLFINWRGQSCNIFALNVPVHPIPSCFNCFISGIELKQLSMYTQNYSGGGLLPEVLQLFTYHQFSKNCDFWFQK